MTYVSHSLEVLNGVVKKAGIGLIRDFTELTQLQSAPKGHEEFTQAAVERTMSILRNELGKFRPDFPIVAKAADLPVTECFVVSPLDGRVNFMRSIPYFAISVAVVKRNDVLAAVVYNPATGDTFFSEKGYGTFKEGSRSHLRLRVSSRNDIAKSLIASTDEKVYQNISAANIRNFGAISLDMASVAAGQIDGLVNRNSNFADIAAGILLVKEAGGRNLAIGQPDERGENIKMIWETGNVISGNPTVCKKLFELV